jgi:hypothetical protein
MLYEIKIYRFNLEFRNGQQGLSFDHLRHADEEEAPGQCLQGQGLVEGAGLDLEETMYPCLSSAW